VREFPYEILGQPAPVSMPSRWAKTRGRNVFAASMSWVASPLLSMALSFRPAECAFMVHPAVERQRSPAPSTRSEQGSRVTAHVSDRSPV
jgi:hypothetical protein